MSIYDISWPLSSATTAYKDKKSITFESIKLFDADLVRESRITLSAHSGTHIDAPSHFERDGAPIDQLDLTQVIGPCKVLDLKQVTDAITAEHLKDKNIQAGDSILCKTANSALPATELFNPHFIYLSFSAAQYLAQQKVKAVGIDYLGIERNQPAHETHHELFKNNITIIEGLRLQEVPEGNYFLCCLPLCLKGLEAAPARAVLISLPLKGVV